VLASDAMNCGACGHSCLGGTCLGGRCQPVKLADVVATNGLAVDDTSLYAANGLSGEVLKLPKNGTGGDTPAVLASIQQNPGSLLVDLAGVYWCNISDLQHPAAGAIMHLAPGDTTPTALADGLNGPETLAVDASDVWWTDRGSAASLGANGSIWHVPLAGGTPEVVVTDTVGPWGVAVDAESVYWVEQHSAQALSGGRVLVLSKTGASSGSATPGQLADNQLEPIRVRLDADHVYWANRGDFTDAYQGGGIFRTGKAGGSVETLVGDEQEPRDFVVDDRYVYWVTARSQVRRAPLSGGTAETLFSDPMGTAYATLAQDATALYWASDRLDPGFEGAAIWRLAK
jgi:sugar lactone lactonase YvrE